MNKILENITLKYKDLDSRVIEFLDRVVSSIDENKADLDYNTLMVEMMVPQLILYYNCIDQFATDGQVMQKDNYNRVAKSPVIMAMQKANDQILNLLEKIAMSPMSKARINKLKQTDDTSAQELLKNLIN